MSCLTINTNVELENVDTSSIIVEINASLANILNEPISYVMVVLRGSASICFGGSEEPAAFGELTTLRSLQLDLNKKVSAKISAILEDKLYVSKDRFYLSMRTIEKQFLGFNGTVFGA